MAFERFARSIGAAKSAGEIRESACKLIAGDLEAMPEAMMIVRLHENRMSIRGKAAVVVQAVSLSADEPETTFTWTLELGRIRIAPTDAAGICMTARLRCEVGTHVRVEIQLDQSEHVLANTLTLSADLVVRVPTDTYEREARSCAPV